MNLLLISSVMKCTPLTSDYMHVVSQSDRDSSNLNRLHLQSGQKMDVPYFSE